MIIVPELRESSALKEALDQLPQLPKALDWGSDVNEANQKLFSEISKEEKCQVFLDWAAKYQPCMFGRLGAKQSKGIAYDMVIVDDDDLNRGEGHVEAVIQAARRAWKEKALQGLSHGFLIFFNSPRLAFCEAGDELLDITLKLTGLYLVESRPIKTDTIYTEAVPLRSEDGFIRLFKGGINVFYTSAHRTPNHDRRIPGGLLVSTNSPGHLANALVQKKEAANLEEATQIIYDLVIRSVGGGGIGDTKVNSCTWHRERQHAEGVNETPDPKKRLPYFVPDNYDPTLYSGFYHTDVTVPHDVTVNRRSFSDAEVWTDLYMDYVTMREFEHLHPDYGFWYGHPIPEEAMFYNPWFPERAYNKKWTEWPHWKKMLDAGYIRL
jgi:hypothetical protein